MGRCDQERGFDNPRPGGTLAGMKPTAKKALKSWTAGELSRLSRLATPDKIQRFLDETTYRVESVYVPPIVAFREGRAHCFDGALLAAAVLRRGGVIVGIVDLLAENDDDHLLCAFRWRSRWGAVSKSNFPGLRFREPVFRSPRELALSYFESYFNTKRQKTLRAHSGVIRLPDPARLDWECSLAGAHGVLPILRRARHYPILLARQKAVLRKVEAGHFTAQMAGVSLRGVY